ncbi:MAG TPA: type II toxin-antitoxin system mRNA interferase toxin, RelE/StbE family [Prolixibacteraceae bacterium]|nr:type II toxin-antitoxin system mRNA interferase toxin, RelE/StbE family [Prolixibacteraceae bacterium]
MYALEITNQYLRDLNLARRRKLDEQKLNQVIRILISGDQLPEQFKNHILTGVYKGLNECHISPDWLLIYSKNKSIKLITLIRTGTHSDLFK